MSHLLTLHDPAAAREHYLSGIWQTDTLYSLARRHATERGTAYALRDGERRLSWSALIAWIDAVAADLHGAGLRRGDRVSIWLPNRLENVVVLLACSRNGYVCNPSLHQNYTVAEITTLLSRIECRALFAQPGWGADAATADVFARAQELSPIKRVYALPALGAADAQMPSVAHPMPMPSATRRMSGPPPSTHPDQIVYLAFTSGTTGAPKGVMHSDNTLLANGRSMVADWNLNEKTVLLTLSPMSHHIGTVALGTPEDPLAAYAGDPGAEIYRACVACHTLSPDEGNRAGPTLAGLFGRKIASLPGYRFTDALKAMDIVWTPETVSKLFEIGPNAYTPGTKMPEQRIGSAEDRRALTDFLARATSK